METFRCRTWAGHPPGHPGGAGGGGLIRTDPDSGFEEFPCRAAAHRGGQHRGGRETHLFAPEIPPSLGAYCFYDCTARQEGRLELCRGGGDDLLKGGTNF